MTQQIKTINQIPQVPMDCWQVAEYLYGKVALDANHLLAGEAADKMREAGWTFLEYNEYGEEVWQPPEGHES